MLSILPLNMPYKIISWVDRLLKLNCWMLDGKVVPYTYHIFEAFTTFLTFFLFVVNFDVVRFQCWSFQIQIKNSFLINTSSPTTPTSTRYLSDPITEEEMLVWRLRKIFAWLPLPPCLLIDVNLTKSEFYTSSSNIHSEPCRDKAGVILCDLTYSPTL